MLKILTMFHRKFLSKTGNIESNPLIIKNSPRKRRHWWLIAIQRDWIASWTVLLGAMLLLVACMDLLFEFHQQLQASKQSRKMNWEMVPNKRQKSKGLLHSSVPVDADLLDYPISWLSHRGKMKDVLIEERSKGKHTTLSKVEIQKRQYSAELEHLETLMKAIHKQLISDTQLRTILGLDPPGRPVGMDDPALIGYLSTTMTNTTVTPHSKWRQHQEQLYIAERLTPAQQEGAFSWPKHQDIYAGVNNFGPGEQIQRRIYKKYFKDGFHLKGFVQVGAKSESACWERQIWRRYANWTGLVVEMQSFDIERYMYAMVAPFCVSPSIQPDVYITKRLSYPKLFESKNGLPDGAMQPHRYETTLLPAGMIEGSVSAEFRKNYAHVVFKAMPCFPLWSIMLAANMTEHVDYLTIGTTGYAGKIVESLPFEKIRPKVVHMADLGPGKSTEKFLNGHGYTMDRSISTSTKENVDYGEFVFFRQRRNY